MADKFHHQHAEGFAACAPYNFVPLPEAVFTPTEELPAQDRYHENRHTGYIKLDLKTETPLYVRCAYPPDTPVDEKTGKPDFAKQPECQHFFHHGDSEIPVIPGSSIRGMTRAMVELLAYAKVSSVVERLIVHRAVGDTTTLGKKYRKRVIGSGAAVNGGTLYQYPLPSLRAGWLEVEGSRRFIRPALEEHGESFVHVEYADFEKQFPNARPHKQPVEVYVKPVTRTTPPRSKPSVKLHLAITDQVEKPSDEAACNANLRKAYVVVTGHMSAGNVKFKSHEFLKLNQLAAKLKTPSDDVSRYLCGKLQQSTKNLLQQYDGSSNPGYELKNAIINDLNNIITREKLVNEAAFKNLPLTLDGQRLTKRIMRGEALLRCNRRLLEAAYPQEIKAKDVTEKHMHCAIYAKNVSAARILIPEAKWEAYEEDFTLTRSEKDKPRELKNGQPLFYLLEKDTNGNEKLAFFGPTMMFRMPYPHSLFEFIPEELRDDNQLDLAESIFGFVNQNNGTIKAGRVCFTDAVWRKRDDNEQPFFDGEYEGRRIPRILSSPKPTSFQLYLTQPEVTVKNGRQDGNSLKSYYDKGQTFIRGAKRYWHNPSANGNAEVFVAPSDQAFIEDYVAKDYDNQRNPKRSKQHTIIRPVRKNTAFESRVYFENLSKLELGALLTALDLPDSKRHKLGMGKPLGLGTVEIKTTLVVQERLSSGDKKGRYEKLFDDEKNWHEGITPPAEVEQLAGACCTEFRQAILKHYQNAAEANSIDAEGGRLDKIPRLAALFTMLEWKNAIQDEEKLKYAEPGADEIKRRYVLPSPQDILKNNQASGNKPLLRKIEPAAIASVQNPPANTPTVQQQLARFFASVSGENAGLDVLTFNGLKVRLNAWGQANNAAEVCAEVTKIASLLKKLVNKQKRDELRELLFKLLEEKKFWRKKVAPWRSKVEQTLKDVSA